MGSAGNYSAEVGVSISYKKTEPNTIQECEAFLAGTDIRVHTEIEADEETMRAKHAEGFDIWLGYGPFEESAQTFSTEWEDGQSIDEVIEFLEEYYDKEYYGAEAVRAAEPADLLNIDLQKLAEYDIKDIDDWGRFSYCFTTVNNDIYYETDNRESNSYQISGDPMLVKMLADETAMIELSGDGGTN